MKLHTDKPVANYIRSFEPGLILLGERRIETDLLIGPGDHVAEWQPADRVAISQEDLAPLVERDPELILVGMGLSQRFLSSSVLTSIMRRGIGVEVMSTEAACRTWNILVGEDRKVAAALLLR